MCASPRRVRTRVRRTGSRCPERQSKTDFCNVVTASARYRHQMAINTFTSDSVILVIDSRPVTRMVDEHRETGGSSGGRRAISPPTI